MHFLNLSGQIPVEYCTLAALSVLRIQATSIRGPMPSCLGGVNNTALFSIQVTSNPLLGGPLPWGAWLRAISPRRRGSGGLRILRLYDNAFVGNAFPADFPDDCSLTSVSLSGNRALTGRVPNSITKCRDLERLQVHQTNLTGLMPVSLCGMCALRSLSIYDTPHLELAPSPSSWSDACKDLFCGRDLDEECRGTDNVSVAAEKMWLRVDGERGEFYRDDCD